MSVLIKGMKMPTSCSRCALFDEGSNGDPDWCNVMHQVPEYETCPLIGIPPHGRLIDADALMHEFEKAQRTMEQHGQEYSCSFMSSSQELSTEWYCVEDMVENAPTIIPAEEDE